MQNNCREKFILWLVSFFILTTAGLAQKSDPPGRALILYDGLSTGYSEGLISANSIANLLGHFSVSYQIQPVESYQKAAMENYSWIFFAGNVEKTQIPRSFLEDLLVTSKTVCWLNRHINQFTVMPESRKKLGFSFIDYRDDDEFEAYRKRMMLAYRFRPNPLVKHYKPN